MKKLNFIALYIIGVLVISVGCSDDDSENLADQEYMIANVDGVNWQVDNSSGLISARKIRTPRGTIELLVEVESATGEMMAFSLSDYVGAHNYILAKDVMNKDWIQFSQMSNAASWINLMNLSSGELQNSVEILSDDGRMVEGSFSFEGHNHIDSSIRRISDGKFKIAIDQ